MSGGPRLHLVETLGTGGFGVVMRAWLEGEHGFVKEVAVKLLSHAASREEHLVQRLRDEARLMGLVRHRAVVRADGLTRIDGRWAVVMEFVHGVSLARLLREVGAPPLSVGIEVIAEVASALAATHAAQDPTGAPLSMLHRDVKPGNVQLTAGGSVKLLDFGNARAEYEAREARTGQLTYGTLAYMAPERFAGAESPAVDVYSLGATAFELLSGHRFGAGGLDAADHRVRRTERLAWLVARLGEGARPVVSLLDSMLRFEPDQRPSPAAVERSLLELRACVPGPSLRLWAMDALPAMLAPTLSPGCPTGAAPGGDGDGAEAGAPKGGGSVTTWMALPIGTQVAAPPPVVRRAGPVTSPALPRRAAPACPRSAPPRDPPVVRLGGPTAHPAGGAITAPISRRSRPDWLMGAFAGAAGLGVLVPFIILGVAGVWAARDALARRVEHMVPGHAPTEERTMERQWPEVEVRPVQGAAVDEGAPFEFARVAPTEPPSVRPRLPPVLPRSAAPERPPPAGPTGSAEPRLPSAVAPSSSGGTPGAPAIVSPTVAPPGGTPPPPPAQVPSPSAAPSPTSSPASVAVRLRGDLSHAVLVDVEGARFVVPGDVPQGGYRVLATFPGRGQVNAGAITVPGTSPLELECLSRFARCRPS